ncbi:lipid-A-disaccharide synthase [Rhizobium sp. Leaf384]|uniref:lipid-A-disaccharide synthase n=1 Tax=unclassified Rhizobium TaxID=2613769 RepID=UPI0007135998|nr:MULTISPECIES: lipid-A-disaccharide synthase [unclassified Rhizobium]KQS79220.1 lipid-A-disaccharide synthase [Rhizobium sp. Leaf384]KQS82789.1 lipid-A-disaccharide synthase [Rhizobium sp. Leaf383]
MPNENRADPLKVAIIAGEVSGDLLGGDLIRALKQRAGPVSLVGVGGEELEAQGLVSLFDYSELSIMGISQVLARLPTLLRRIRQTADAVIAARPDVLVIIDSPDFTHRVAKRVRAALPSLPIVDYVCPSVWAWKPERALRMRPYVDHVLAVLPFEPDAMATLGGPPTTYVGHRLASDEHVLSVRAAQWAKGDARVRDGWQPTCLLLPGSRSSEITRLLPVFREAVEILAKRSPGFRFVLPTVPRQADTVRALVRDWPVDVEVRVGAQAKWAAFAQADVAMAASGTVILELGLCSIPVVSTYKADWLIRMMHKRIRIWTANLPNLIGDYVIVPEYFNESIRPGALARWMERLAADTPERRAMIGGFDAVWDIMRTEVPPGERAAALVMETIATKAAG